MGDADGLAPYRSGPSLYSFEVDLGGTSFTAFYTLDYCAKTRVWKMTGEVRSPASGEVVAVSLQGPHVGLLFQRYAIEAERAAVLLVAREEKWKKSKG